MSQHLNLSTETRLALSRIEAVIFDIDDTLTFAKDTNFFAQFGQMVERAVGQYYLTSPMQAKEITNFYRKQYI